MRVNVCSTTPWLAIVLLTASSAWATQPQVGAPELARARTLLTLSRAELSAEQFALLSRRLAAAESAYAEFTMLARASRAAVVISEGGAAAATSAGARATTTAGRALLSGSAELLPFLLLIWPSTAHAPGIQQETPAIRAARSKVEEKFKDLADAARKVDLERQAAASRAPDKNAATTRLKRKVTCELKGGNVKQPDRKIRCSYFCPGEPPGVSHDILLDVAECPQFWNFYL